MRLINEMVISKEFDGICGALCRAFNQCPFACGIIRWDCTDRTCYEYSQKNMQAQDPFKKKTWHERKE
jgi:hypothetical protein